VCAGVWNIGFTLQFRSPLACDFVVFAVLYLVATPMTSQSILPFVSHDEGLPAIPLPEIPPQEITDRSRAWYLVDHVANRDKGSKRLEVWDISDQYIAINDLNKVVWR
jgi:hypothetical protein